MRYVLKWFSGARFQRFAAFSRRLYEDMLDAPMKEVERAMVRICKWFGTYNLTSTLKASGDAKVSMTSGLLEEYSS